MCTVALNQGRFTTSQFILKVILKATNSTEIFADLPGFQVNETTLPADEIESLGEGSKIDHVILRHEQKIITLHEFT